MSRAATVAGRVALPARPVAGRVALPARPGVCQRVARGGRVARVDCGVVVRIWGRLQWEDQDRKRRDRRGEGALIAECCPVSGTRSFKLASKGIVSTYIV